MHQGLILTRLILTLRKPEKPWETPEETLEPGVKSVHCPELYSCDLKLGVLVPIVKPHYDHASGFDSNAFDINPDKPWEPWKTLRNPEETMVKICSLSRAIFLWLETWCAGTYRQTPLPPCIRVWFLILTLRNPGNPGVNSVHCPELYSCDLKFGVQVPITKPHYHHSSGFDSNAFDINPEKPWETLSLEPLGKFCSLPRAIFLWVETWRAGTCRQTPLRPCIRVWF